MEIFGELERFAAGLYPFRFAVGGALVIVLVVGAGLLVRLGLLRFALRHRTASAVIVVAAALIGLPATYYLASPLFRTSEVFEASPVAGAAVTGPSSGGLTGSQPDANSSNRSSAANAAPTPAHSTPFSVRTTAAGEFKGADEFHFGRGKAQLIETAPGRFTLRFEDFAVRNGPDLYVYLSPRADGFAPDALNLGRLKADRGAFNYELPENVDPAMYKSVVVWCRQFAVLFSWATLQTT